MANLLDENKIKELLGITDDDLSADSGTVIDTPDSLRKDKILTSEMVFEDLTILIQNGNNILATIQHVLDSTPDNSDMFKNASLIMTTIKDTMKEFTNVYMEDKKHQNRMELEQMKIDARLHLMKEKANMGAISAESTQSQGVSYSQEDLIKNLIEYDD